MANVTLIRPAFSTEIYGTTYATIPKYREVRPPLGLAYLAGSLEKEGHKVSIVDGEPKLLTLEDTVKQVISTNPDFVGITSTTPEFYFASNILKAIKAYDPKIVTMAGGSHVSALPEYTVDRHPEIDYVVVAEGEKGILRVMDVPKERVIRSRGFQDEIDPRTNVRPARHLLNYDNYAYGDPVLGTVRSDAIEGQRSCPFKCHFCFRGVGTKVRERSYVDVVDELEDTYKRHNLNHAIFFDDTFTMRRDRTHNLCEEILKRDIKMHYYCFTAANTLNHDLLKHMKEAGFTMITLGIESGNAQILKSVGKAAKKEAYVAAYQNMENLGIETRGSVILGHPFENHSTIHDTLNFVTEDLRLQRLGVNVLMPFPGTKTWFQAIEGDGLKFTTSEIGGVDHDWSAYKRWGNCVIETRGLTSGGGLTREDLIFYHEYILNEFYTHPRVVGHSEEQKLKGNHDEYYHRPITNALKWKAKFLENEKKNPHRFSNGMTLNEVKEDLRANPNKYSITEYLKESEKKGIVDAAPESFTAPPTALSASGAPIRVFTAKDLHASE
jgi:anaerobic magnesium-protoporphyrin IX monomethyl ester cyclase